MEYRRLGKTDINVSYLGFGASPLGDMYGKTEIDEIMRTVDAAIDAGINYFDVAPSYGPRGLAEERLGKALHGKRDKIILNTKIGREDTGSVEKAEYIYDYSPEKVRSSVVESLRRLRTEYIDVYQVHDFTSLHDNRYIAEQTIPVMQKLREEGKIRFIGINSSSIGDLIDLASLSSIDTILNFTHYSLIDQTLDEKLSPFARKNDIGLINASILHMGLLTPSVRVLYNWNRTWDGDQARIKDAVFEANRYCESQGINISDIAIKFAMDYKGVDSTLIGIGRMNSLVRSLRAIELDIDDEHIKHVHEMLKFIPSIIRRPRYNQAKQARPL